jgi:hypothetical protein
MWPLAGADHRGLGSNLATIRQGALRENTPSLLLDGYAVLACLQPQR